MSVEISPINNGSTLLSIYIVDAFTDVPFSGNPAAVCLVLPGQNITAKEMQKIGNEMNLSETAFVFLEKGDFQSANTFGLRWFTPTTEVDLCGHATLAASAVLFREKGNDCDKISFSTRSGELTVSRSEQNRIALNFPLNPPTPQILDDIKGLLKTCLKDLTIIQDVQLSATGKLLLRLKDCTTRNELEEMKPLVKDMVNAESSGLVKGVGLTIKGSPDNGCVDNKGQVYDFISRYFAPWLGIEEDPVTGAWHTVAAAYWAKELNKTSLYARQCSSRGGDLWLTVQDQRLILSGDAVINMRGTFIL
ncbi:unnamed protein product [Lymnaea stagnalis]|uniref:Phenazine biosynthesis-like domain-containing protein n=1 Tax=Lymnaea stagnalis TaxID=6523 RepID=A0AAV2I386_LYMST